MYYLLIVIPFFPLLAFIIYKRLFNPITLYIGVLTVQFLLYSIFPLDEYSLLKDETVKVISLGMISFIIGYIFVFIPLLSLKNMKIKVAISGDMFLIEKSKIERYYFIFTLIVILTISFHAVIGVYNGLSGPYGNFFVNVRMVYLNDLSSFGLWPHALILCQVYYMYCILFNVRLKKSVIIYILLSLTPLLFKLERTSLLCSMLALLIVVDIKLKNGISYFRFFLFIIFFIFAFGFVAYQFDPSRGVTGVFNVFIKYFSKNLDMFNKYIVNIDPIYDIRLLIGPYSKLFFLDKYEFNLPTDGAYNTYSYLKNIYMYGGLLFVCVFNFFLGLLCSLIYSNLFKLNYTLLIFYSFFSFSLFMAFFDFTFYWTNWLYYAVSLILINVLCIRRV